MIIHIPHASTLIPAGDGPDLPPSRLEHEITVMTDWYCDRLFASAAPRLIFPVSRLVCDPERFRDDEREPMSARGMGAVYTRCSDGSPLRRLTPGKREALLRRYYDPHHAALARLVEAELERSGRALIVDGHSFHPVPLPYETQTARPDFCIGTDPYHTPRPLARLLLDFFREQGLRAAENAPFAGSIVPLDCWRRDRRVSSVMIEVNRGLYLSGSREPGPGFRRIRALLGQALALLAQYEAAR